MSHSSEIKKQIITAGDMSLTSLTSLVTQINFADNVGVQLNFTGTPSGTFSVEVSIDYSQDVQGNVTSTGNWMAIDFGVAPAAVGAPDNIYLDMNQLSAPWIRVKYTRSAGTGTLDAFIAFKVL